METECVSLMFNTTSITNDSLLLGEFPYWRVTLSLSLLGSYLLSGYVIIIHLLLLVVLLRIKKEHSKPLNLIHISLLVSTILEDVLRIVLDTLYLPSLQRHCVCSHVVGTIVGLKITFFAVYRPFTFACLGVLQHLVILGKRKFVNVKIACGMITCLYCVVLLSRH